MAMIVTGDYFWKEYELVGSPILALMGKVC